MLHMTEIFGMWAANIAEISRENVEVTTAPTFVAWSEVNSGDISGPFPK